MIIFLRSQLPRTDSRLQRYILALKNKNSDYKVVGWNREGEVQTDERNILYHKKALIGGGVRNIFSLILWNIFLFKILLKERKEIKTIHAIDFDTVIPAYIFSFLFRKEFILDIYDKYTDARNMPLFISKIIDKIELFCCIRASKLILPDVCRIKQLKLPNSVKPIIIENVPLVPNFKKSNAELHVCPLIFSYVGILEKNHRGLENLLEVISRYSDVKLHIAGDGELKSYVQQMSRNFKNIIYYGAVSQEKALEIMSKSHIIVGMYYKTIKNHLYASPNKYYEHLYLGRALLTTYGTPPGNKVLEHNTGYVIGETMKNIEEFIKNIEESDLKRKSENALNLWNLKYHNYYQVISGLY